MNSSGCVGDSKFSARVFFLYLFHTASLPYLIEEQHHAQKYHLFVYDYHNDMQTFPTTGVSMSFSENIQIVRIKWACE